MCVVFSSCKAVTAHIHYIVIQLYLSLVFLPQYAVIILVIIILEILFGIFLSAKGNQLVSHFGITYIHSLWYVIPNNYHAYTYVQSRC